MLHYIQKNVDLLIIIWHVLTKKKEGDHNVDPHAVARSLMAWCFYYHLAHSNGMRRIECIRKRLIVLGILD
jgi:hypothetical protein